MDEQPLLSRLIDVNSIPAAGLTRTVEATAAERSAIAEEYGLVEVRSLAGTATLGAGRRGEVSVVGTVAAEIVQSCIVTLEPVVQVIAETFSVAFVPEDSKAATQRDEVFVDPVAGDPPDTYSHGRIDLGAVILEQVALAIDPYPRSPGAELPDAPLAPAGPEDSPFAALAPLKRGRNS